MTDLAERLRASNDAQECVRDLLKGGEAVLTAGNALFMDLNDFEAFQDTVAAILEVNIAFSEFLKIARFEINDAA